MRKALLYVVGVGAMGVGVWAASSVMHEGEPGPPLPGSKPNPVAKITSPLKPSSVTPAAKLPETQPAVALASRKAAALPSYLYLNFDHQPTSPQDLGTPYRFPPARLRVSARADEPVTALLFSDDPKEAINKDWAGDRYYFSMALQQQISDVGQLDGLDWPYSASTSEKEETADGIFLHGDQFHLEPVQATVHFQGQAPHLLILISGEFIQYDTSDPNAAPRHCWINGSLAPRVESK